MSEDARTDEYRDLLDDVVDGHALDSNQVDAIRDLLDERDSLAAEVDRLRAELDRHRVAGDEVLWELARVGPELPESTRALLLPKIAAWRSVRGDAPAVGGDAG